MDGSAGRSVLLCCAVALLLCPLLAQDAAEEQVQGIRVVYALSGSNLTIPGVESELKGDGFLEWSKKTVGTESQSILDYRYGRKGADLQEIYKERVDFFNKNASFRLLGATKHDSGLYVLKLLISGEEKHVLVIVLDPVSEVSVVQVLSNNSLTLECNASGDVWNISWGSRDSPETQNATCVGNWSKLVIPADSRGIYTCVASNPISTLAKEYSLLQESSDLHLCTRPSHSTLTWLVAVLAVAAIIIFIYCCCCRRDGRIKHYMAVIYRRRRWREDANVPDDTEGHSNAFLQGNAGLPGENIS